MTGAIFKENYLPFSLTIHHSLVPLWVYRENTNSSLCDRHWFAYKSDSAIKLELISPDNNAFDYAAENFFHNKQRSLDFFFQPILSRDFNAINITVLLLKTFM